MKIKAVVLGSLIFGSLFVSCASTDAKALQERREVQTEVTSFISGIDGVSEGYAVYTKEKKVRVFIDFAKRMICKILTVFIVKTAVSFCIF